jgi:hypothetical protein
MTSTIQDIAARVSPPKRALMYDCGVENLEFDTYRGRDGPEQYPRRTNR